MAIYVNGQVPQERLSVESLQALSDRYQVIFTRQARKTISTLIARLIEETELLKWPTFREAVTGSRFVGCKSCFERQAAEFFAGNEFVEEWVPKMLHLDTPETPPARPTMFFSPRPTAQRRHHTHYHHHYCHC